MLEVLILDDVKSILELKDVKRGYYDLEHNYVLIDSVLTVAELAAKVGVTMDVAFGLYANYTPDGSDIAKTKIDSIKIEELNLLFEL